MLASQSYKPNYDEWKVVFRMLNTTLSAIFHKHQRALRARQSQSQWSQSSENYRDVAKKENKVFQFIFKVKILRCFSPSQMRDDRGTDLIWFTHVYDVLYITTLQVDECADDWLTDCREIYRVPNGLWLLPIQSSALQHSAPLSLPLPTLLL